jgi:hypothetical protein
MPSFRRAEVSYLQRSGSGKTDEKQLAELVRLRGLLQVAADGSGSSLRLRSRHELPLRGEIGFVQGKSKHNISADR